jgi:hypothetical protein
LQRLNVGKRIDLVFGELAFGRVRVVSAQKKGSCDN